MILWLIPRKQRGRTRRLAWVMVECSLHRKWCIFIYISCEGIKSNLFTLKGLKYFPNVLENRIAEFGRGEVIVSKPLERLVRFPF